MIFFPLLLSKIQLVATVKMEEAKSSMCGEDLGGDGRAAGSVGLL